MKKYIIGFIAGALFATAGAVYADDVVLIGKQIQGQTTVYKDGERLDSAIIVDGKSYAPTRAIGEAAGYEVKFDEGEIFLVSPETEVVVEPEKNNIPEEAFLPPVEEVNTVYDGLTIEEVDRQIASLNESIQKYKVYFKYDEATIEKKVQLDEFIATKEAEIAKLEEKKAELEAQQ